MSALKLAKGIIGDWSKIGVLDTENGSSNLYADLGEFGVESFSPPYSPDRYVKAIDYFVKQGVELMIIDSITPEWDGQGGVLEMHKRSGGTFRDWDKVNPHHKSFLDAILFSPIHIITTTRKKQDHVITDGANGKKEVKKVGLKDIQRDGFEYELTLAFDINMDHLALASKDRTNLFNTEIPFLLDESVGDKIREWNLRK